MSTFSATQPVKRITVEAVITRADGRVEKVGVVSAWHRNPLMRLWYRLRGIGRVRGTVTGVK